MSSVLRVSFLMGVATLNVVAAPAAAPRAHDWARIEAAAEACHVKVLKRQIPNGLRSLVREPAYNLGTDSTTEGRTCFYRLLKMSDIERLLREKEFSDLTGSAR